MNEPLFSAESLALAWRVLQTEFPKAIAETLLMTLLSTAIAVLLGLPLGVLLATGRKDGVLPLPAWLYRLLNGGIDLLRSVPFLILMIMVFPLSRLIVGTTVGTAATVVPLAVAAFPFVARLAEGSLREVDPNLIEAAESMGATPVQIVVKVMLPEALPSLISGVTIAVTTVLGYSAMSGIIGGGGLGNIAITYGYYRYRYLVMLLAVLVLVMIVGVLQGCGTWLSRRLDRRLKKKL